MRPKLILCGGQDPREGRVREKKRSKAGKRENKYKASAELAKASKTDR